MDGEPPARVSKGMVKYAAALSKESVVDVEGDVVKPDAPISGATVQVELHATAVRCVSRADGALPFELEDAGRPDSLLDAEGSTYVRVNQDTRLDNRVIDLRTPANQAIFRIQSMARARGRE